MGWLEFERPSEGIKKHLDDGYNSSTSSARTKLIKSCIKHFNTYYAAVEVTDLKANTSSVIAVIVMLQYPTPNTVAIKSLEESACPVRAAMPLAMLKLLTPVDDIPFYRGKSKEYVLDWRARCESNALLYSSRWKPMKVGDVVEVYNTPYTIVSKPTNKTYTVEADSGQIFSLQYSVYARHCES